MLKESFDKALKYLGRLGEVDSTFIVLDIEGSDLVIYSDKQLPGYSSINGVYAKNVGWKGLHEGEQEKIKEWLSRGPESRVGLSENVFERSLETEVLAVREKSSKGLESYCFIPTKKAAKIILRYYYGSSAMWTPSILDYPIDALIVHEGLHGGIGFDLRRDLCIALEERGYIDRHDYPVVHELFSQLGEMYYMEKNHPEFATKREQMMKNVANTAWMYEVQKARNISGCGSEFYADPHGKSSEVYLRMRQDPNVWCFSKLLFSEPYEGSAKNQD